MQVRSPRPNRMRQRRFGAIHRRVGRSVVRRNHQSKRRGRSSRTSRCSSLERRLGIWLSTQGWSWHHRIRIARRRMRHSRRRWSGPIPKQLHFLQRMWILLRRRLAGWLGGWKHSAQLARASRLHRCRCGSTRDPMLRATRERPAGQQFVAGSVH